MLLVPADLSDRGACNQTLSYTPQVMITESGRNRIISSNSIPDHQVGLFGQRNGALNPNAIREVSESYTIPLHPTLASSITYLWNNESGPEYELGVLLNGVLLDPEAAEPFPHEGFFSSDVNLEWNLDAMIINLGLDCNNAHVQPRGKYHHHGAPTLSSSFSLKNGERPGDGVTAPCGTYNGVYTNDWEFINSQGDLDECNGRNGLTPEYPNGTYYYVITDAFPFLPRCLKGTPSTDFRLR